MPFPYELTDMWLPHAIPRQLALPRKNLRSVRHSAEATQIARPVTKCEIVYVRSFEFSVSWYMNARDMNRTGNRGGRLV